MESYDSFPSLPIGKRSASSVQISGPVIRYLA
jgi:hypothetical protein